MSYRVTLMINGMKVVSIGKSRRGAIWSALVSHSLEVENLVCYRVVSWRKVRVHRCQ